MGKFTFPEDCKIAKKSRELFLKIAASERKTLLDICGPHGRAECPGYEDCGIVPEAQPFSKRETPGLGGFPT